MQRSRTIGFYLFVVYFVVNLIPAIYSIVQIKLGNHAPGLYYLYSKETVATIDSKILHMADGFGILLNILIVAYCMVCLGIVWYIYKNTQHAGKAFILLISSLVLVQIGSYFSDYYFGSQNVLILHVTSVFILIASLSFGRGIVAKTSRLS